MIYYVDTEFIEFPSTIELLSIALVAADGRELYCVNSEADTSRANEFVKKRVLPNLAHPDESVTGSKTASEIKTLGDYVVGRVEIGERIRQFVLADRDPEFYGYFADYDWVALCWLFGPMVMLPTRFPMFCRDLKQTLSEIERATNIDPRDYAPRSPLNHNALEDARWMRDLHKAVRSNFRCTWVRELHTC